MEKVDMVFISSPLMGHFTQALELAKLMINQNDKLSFTFLIMQLPFDPTGTVVIKSIATASATNNIRFLYLPSPEDTSEWCSTHRGIFLSQLVEYQKPNVKKAVKNSPNKVGGFILDMQCTAMMDVAADLKLPSYVFFTSPAGYLGLMLYFQSLHDEHNQDISKLRLSTSDIVVPCFAKSLPPGVLPTPLMDKVQWDTRFLHYSRSLRSAKAIIVNTFAKLESHALTSFFTNEAYGTKTSIPPIYPVGPVLNKTHNGPLEKYMEIIEWLDDQPQSSVVYLCFGSIGAIDEEQVKEIAKALERSGCRFLWSLRRPPSKDKVGFPTEYANHEEVLPKGFLDRTAKTGKVVGWSPQFAVLSHPSVGGFVSHCGWNSILESLWCGVPIATWPLYAEQQLNAFLMVEVLGMAVQITLDYNDRNVNQAMVTAEQIEEGINKVMDSESELRKKVKEMSDKSKTAISKGGSSHATIAKIIEEIMDNAIHVS